MKNQDGRCSFNGLAAELIQKDLLFRITAVFHHESAKWHFGFLGALKHPNKLITYMCSFLKIKTQKICNSAKYYFDFFRFFSSS